MHEVGAKEIPSIFTIRKIIQEGLGKKEGVHGVGRVHTASAEDLKIPVRTDNPKDILKEGIRMGAIDSIRISHDSTVTAEVISTIAGSSHTVYAVPYVDALQYWKEKIEKFGYTRDEETPFVAGTLEGHAEHIPMQLITWVMIKVRTGTEPDDFVLAPVDIYQLAKAQHGGERQLDLPGLVKDHPEQTSTVTLTETAFTEIYESVEKHLHLQSEYLKDMYNGYVRPRVNAQLKSIGIEVGEKEIVDIANTMALGYYRDKKSVTGMGGGPQSNQFFHAHSTAYPDLDYLRKLIVEKVIVQSQRQRSGDYILLSESPDFDPHLIYKLAQLFSIPDITDEQILERLGPESKVKDITKWLEDQRGWLGNPELDQDAVKRAIVEKAHEVQQTLQSFQNAFNQGPPVFGKLEFEDPDTFPPWLVFKQTDAYGTLFHELMDEPIQNLLFEIFSPLGVTKDQIKSFKYHTEPHRLDMRMAEGWSVDVNCADFIKINAGLNKFLYTMSGLWSKGYDAWEAWYTRKDTSLLDQLQGTFHLSGVTRETIKRILPTDQQLVKWITEGELDAANEERLQTELDRRNDPKLRARAKRRITTGGLKDKALAFGLYQVLSGNVYTERRLDGSEKEVKFNQGFNIPGVPGFGTKLEELVEGGWRLHIYPLLSEKAMAEVEAGYALFRDQPKNTNQTH